MKKFVYVVVNTNLNTIISVSSQYEEALNIVFFQQTVNGISPEDISITPAEIDVNYNHGIPMCYDDMEVNLTEDILECWPEEEEEEEEEEVMPEYYDWREDEDEDEDEDEEENDHIADYINLKKDMLLTSYLEDGYSYKEAREAVKRIFEDDD